MWSGVHCAYSKIVFYKLQSVRKHILFIINQYITNETVNDITQPTLHVSRLFNNLASDSPKHLSGHLSTLNIS